MDYLDESELFSMGMVSMASNLRRHYEAGAESTQEPPQEEEHQEPSPVSCSLC